MPSRVVSRSPRAEETRASCRCDRLPCLRSRKVLIRQVADLRPHPENVHIYGDAPDPDLVKSIRELGVLEPLVVTEDGVVLSGCRRLAAAGEAGLGEVPVVLFAPKDELEALETL